MTIRRVFPQQLVKMIIQYSARAPTLALKNEESGCSTAYDYSHCRHAVLLAVLRAAYLIRLDSHAHLTRTLHACS